MRTLRRPSAMPTGLSLRMVVASGLLALLLVSAFAVLLLAIRELRESTESRRETREALVAADELEKLVIDLETGLRGFVITGDDAFLEPWHAARAAVPREAAALERLVAGNGSQERRARLIGDAAERYVEDYGLPLLAAVRRDDPTADSVEQTATGKRLTDGIRGEFDRFTSVARAQLGIREDSADAAARRAILVGGIGVGASLLLILLFTGYLTRLIVRPIRRAAHMADQLAGGDLKARMSERDVGEIGALERSFNVMACSLEGSRDELASLFAEQAALRRIATLVAQGAPPTDVFAATAAEAGQLLAAGAAALGRYEPEEAVTMVAIHGEPYGGISVGTTIPLEGPSVSRAVFETGRAARRDTMEGAVGAFAEIARTTRAQSVAGAPVVVEGRLWGVLVMTSRDLLPADTEQRLVDFTELVATAIANAESRAELAASRARVVAASDETRRRIERDLHDGVQQRLVSLALELRGAETTVPAQLGELQVQLTRIGDGLIGALEDLREISRGIHPAILSEGGLAPALRAMARRSAVPVELDVSTEGPLPERVEVAAYYVASEALANAAKHARASAVDLRVERRNGALHLAISDDGIGGADPRRGSGLIGLRDRVSALGGTISMESPAGEGTSLEVVLPVD